MNTKQLLDALNKLIDINGPGDYVLTVPGIGNKEPVAIGELFGMKVIADPVCAEDKWYIRQGKDL